MLYLDYNWDLSPNRILFDEELNIDKLGWKHGDYFRIENHNGKAMLVKVDPLIKFIKEGERACTEANGNNGMTTYHLIQKSG